MLLELGLGKSFQDIGLVLYGHFGGLLDPSVVTRNFEKLARETGNAGVRLHDLRHGHASGLILAGVHPRAVQECLGHASAAGIRPRGCRTPTRGRKCFRGADVSRNVTKM